MKELTIYQFQAEQIEDTLRICANLMKAYDKDTCQKRNIMQSWEYIKNVIAEEKDKQVTRF